MRWPAEPGQARDIELRAAAHGNGASSSIASPAGDGSSHEPWPSRIGASSFEDLSIADGPPAAPQGRGQGTNSIAHLDPSVIDPPLPRLGIGGQSSTALPVAWLPRACLVCRITIRAVSICYVTAILLISVLRTPNWMIEDEGVRSRVLSTLFAGGLFLVATEDVIGINKSAVTLILAATMWTYLAVSFRPLKSAQGADVLHHELDKGLQDVGSVILFLLPAMGVVESIDHFHGFALVTLCIRKVMAGHKERLMPIICIITFFLSSVIDNLTATIVALKLLRHIVARDDGFRQSCGGCVVLAANAGGAWSPIGDVTTTMLWIHGKITTGKTVSWLFLPSLVVAVLPLLGIYWQTSKAIPPTPQATQAGGGRSFSQLQEDSVQDSTEKVEAGKFAEQEPLRFAREDETHEEVTVMRTLVFTVGVLLIMMVPALKISTALPPYLGMLLALGLLWLIADFLDLEASEGNGGNSTHEHGASAVGIVAALHKVDLTGLLFFAGILLAVEALNSAKVLATYAKYIKSICGNNDLAVASLLGVSSAVVDNVPLVEASMGMFNERTTNDPMWQLIALAAGTGGSMLSVGSIAGVTFMSIENIGFAWYCRHISGWASVGFIGGIIVYQLQRAIFG
mmetsp:Transcript_83949/g.166644  ORF Transcript_83949/g.166644 Transcript_83949/m.166644 type:complete len:626 (-) Transcript_83949:76-1953(-)